LVGAPEHGQAGFFELGPPPEQYPIKAAVDSLPIKPEEGLMILFPSYFYHRTIPFEAGERPISISLDPLPRGGMGAPPAPERRGAAAFRRARVRGRARFAAASFSPQRPRARCTSPKPRPSSLSA